jgi:hypothetical protein
VRLDCAKYGLKLIETAEVCGMYGGLMPTELRQVARQLRRAARKDAQHGTRAGHGAGCRCPDCAKANARGEHNRRLGVPA